MSAVYRSAVPLVVAGLSLLLLWAVVGAQPLAAASSNRGAQFAIFSLYLVIFGALALNVIGRLMAVTIGATVALGAGIALRFYSPPDAVAYLAGKVDTFVLLVGVGVVTSLVEESGWFEVLAARILRSAGVDRRKVFARLCVVTYVLSMFINNLATILVIIPISLRVADELDLDPVSLVLGEVIASNLGGASTMIGDFPNMLIATEIQLPFHLFLVYLAPVALLQLALLIWYLAPKALLNHAGGRLRPQEHAAHTRPSHVLSLRGPLILACMVLGFLLGGWANLSPALIAAAAATAALLFGNIRCSRLVRGSHLRDAAFFACLFVMVGAVSASGILDGISEQLTRLWAESAVLSVIAIAWGAALLTCVLNAGPTTALLIHVLAVGTGAASGQPVIWWALSLGVCAGSSATLTGATAGPIAAGLLERQGSSLSFGRFAQTGLPLMLLFLGVSSIYLALLVA